MFNQLLQPYKDTHILENFISDASLTESLRTRKVSKIKKKVKFRNTSEFHRTEKIQTPIKEQGQMAVIPSLISTTNISKNLP